MVETFSSSPKDGYGNSCWEEGGVKGERQAFHAIIPHPSISKLPGGGILLGHIPLPLKGSGGRSWQKGRNSRRGQKDSDGEEGDQEFSINTLGLRGRSHWQRLTPWPSHYILQDQYDVHGRQQLVLLPLATYIIGRCRTLSFLRSLKVYLLDFVLFNHQLIWDGCCQLLQVLFITDQREEIMTETQKLVLDPDERSSTKADLINAVFPLT